MRSPNLIMLVAAIAPLATTSAIPRIASAQAAPPKTTSMCSPMPYTAEKADEAMGLQLKLIGLKKAKTADAGDKPPLLDGGVDLEKYKRQIAGNVTQAVNEVAGVYFCRLTEANPSKAEDLKDARLAFMEDVDLIFDAENFKDVASKAKLSATLKARCKTAGCPEVPRVLADDQLGAVAKSENFTKIVLTNKGVYGSVKSIADGNGCWNVVNASILSAPGAYLGSLQGTAGVLNEYLKGGKSQLIGLTLLKDHASSAIAAAGKQRDSVSDIVSKDPKIGSCLTKVAQVAVPGAAPQAETDAKKDDAAKKDDTAKKDDVPKKDEAKAGDAKVSIKVGDKTLTLTGDKP